MAVFYSWIICLSAAFSLCIAVDICSNGTESGSTVILNGTSNTKDNCGCVLLLTGNTGTNVTFSSNIHPQGCQYKLVYDFKQNKKEYHCRNFPNIPNQYLYPGYNFTVMLEIYENTNAGFIFSLKMSTESNYTGILTISCYTSDKPILPDSTSTFPTPSDKPTTIVSKTTTDQTSPTTDQTTPTTDHNTPTNDQAVNDQTARNDIEEKSDPLAVIIGCSVSGAVLISIVIITVVVCFQKRRKQQLTDCINDSSRSETMPDNSIQNNYNQTGTIPPNLYSNPDSVDNYVNDFHRYEHLPKQREPVPDTCIETENDLSQDNKIELNHNLNKVNKNNVYCSSDSVDNYVNDFHRYEHLPKQQESVPDTGIEHDVALKEIKSSSNQDSEIELNSNKNNVKVDKVYENLTKA